MSNVSDSMIKLGRRLGVIPEDIKKKYKRLVEAASRGVMLKRLLETNEYKYGLKPIYDELKSKYERILLYGESPEKREEARIRLKTLSDINKKVETLLNKVIEVEEFTEKHKEKLK